jgi:orotate phosphoribosyltransferase
MQNYKKEFIKFLIRNQALQFGEFTLKSGRISPYFLNTGKLYSGEALSQLGYYYSECLMDQIKDSFNVVFGPAYKGIPLAVSTVQSLYQRFNVNVSYAFNRKEAKDHGDKGMVVGKPLEATDKIVVVDDVITAGTAVRESIAIIKKMADAPILAVVVSVDRMEKGQGNISAIQELNQATGIRCISLITIEEIITFLEENNIDGKMILTSDILHRYYLYRDQYGIASE